MKEHEPQLLTVRLEIRLTKMQKEILLNLKKQLSVTSKISEAEVMRMALLQMNEKGKRKNVK